MDQDAGNTELDEKRKFVQPRLRQETATAASSADWELVSETVSF